MVTCNPACFEQSRNCETNTVTGHNGRHIFYVKKLTRIYYLAVQWPAFLTTLKPFGHSGNRGIADLLILALIMILVKVPQARAAAAVRLRRRARTSESQTQTLALDHKISTRHVNVSHSGHANASYILSMSHTCVTLWLARSGLGNIVRHASLHRVELWGRASRQRRRHFFFFFSSFLPLLRPPLPLLLH